MNQPQEHAAATPQPCIEWPNCEDDEGLCLACTEYQRWLDAGAIQRDLLGQEMPLFVSFAIIVTGTNAGWHAHPVRMVGEIHDSFLQMAADAIRDRLDEETEE